MNDNMNMDNTITGSMNNNMNMDNTITGSMNDNMNMDNTITGSMNDNMNMDLFQYLIQKIDVPRRPLFFLNVYDYM
jgi:hypothetical protein